MNISVLQTTLQKTLTGQITFPQVVAALVAEGVESYHVDLVREEFSYYQGNGYSLVEKAELTTKKPAHEFSVDQVRAAIRASQVGEIKFKEFIDRLLDAGCVFYITYLAGKKVIYFGRNGDFHVENFPVKS